MGRFGLLESRGGTHDGYSPRIDSKRSINSALPVGLARIYREIAPEAFACAEAGIRDLVTDGAGNSVRCEPVTADCTSPEGKVGEDRALPSVCLCLKACHRHMTLRTFVFDGFPSHGMVHDFPPD